MIKVNVNSPKREELERVLKEVRGQMASTILSYEERDPRGFKWGASSYNGNCSGKVPLGFIDKLGAKSVCELFAGSGTLSDVCNDFNIPYAGIDLNPNPVRGNIYSMDIADMSQELPNEFYEADLCYSHPPYPGLNHVKYAGKAWKDTVGGLEKKDIQNMPFDEGMKLVNLSTMRAYTALPAGSYLVVLVGEIRSNGRYYSMMQNLVLPGEHFQTYVKLQHNTWSDRQTYSGNCNPRAMTGHEMIAVIKKPSGYEIAYVVPTKYAMDIRDSVGTATWKDVVMSVMKNLKHASLENIYKEIDGHKKAKSNEHWKAKVRQTLQILRDGGFLMNPTTGVWSLTA